MAIVLTSGIEARECIDRIRSLDGEITPEVESVVAQKEAVKLAREEGMAQ